MQKILCIIGACFLGASIYWKTTESLPIIDDLLLKNVEALAQGESGYHITCCSGSGSSFLCICGSCVWGYTGTSTKGTCY